MRKPESDMERIEFWNAAYAEGGREEVLKWMRSTNNSKMLRLGQQVLDREDKNVSDGRYVEMRDVTKNARLAAWIAAVASVIAVCLAIKD